MRFRAAIVLAMFAGAVCAAMVAVRAAQRGAPAHEADDAAAPGSVDQWPPVPRRPEG